MSKMQGELQGMPEWENIRLVSVTVDPEHDTPEQLRIYAGWMNADAQRWLFLTGPLADVRELVRGGFKLVADDSPANEAEPIVHSQKFVLVDRKLRVRGYYDAEEAEGYAKLMTDLKRVVKE